MVDGVLNHRSVELYSRALFSMLAFFLELRVGLFVIFVELPILFGHFALLLLLLPVSDLSVQTVLLVVSLLLDQLVDALHAFVEL